MSTFTAYRNGATEGRLELTRGGTHVSIRAGEIEQLCRAVFAGVQPEASADGSLVRIEYPRVSMPNLFRHPRSRAVIELAAGMAWRVAIGGGLGDSNVDLAGADLRELRIAGGAGSVRIVLPEPRGLVRVLIDGGASRVTLVHPEGTAVGLRIARGATKVRFDGVEHPSRGGETRLETAGAAGATDRYEIEVRGGASRLTVTDPETELDRASNDMLAVLDGAAA
jgi:hypothetical protein